MNDDSWAAITRRYTPRLIGVAMQQGLSYHDALDIVQDVWIRLLEHAAAVNPATLDRWLWAATRNGAVSHWRHHHRMTFPGELPEQLVPDFADAVTGADWAARAIQALPAGQRAAVIALLANDGSYEATAKELRLAKGTVASHIHRARITLSNTREDVRES